MLKVEKKQFFHSLSDIVIYCDCVLFRHFGGLNPCTFLYDFFELFLCVAVEPANQNQMIKKRWTRIENFDECKCTLYVNKFWWCDGYLFYEN